MIDILLATYNSSQYIHEQLNSILEQDCQDWTLIIRDDNSNDNTPQILAEYQEKYPDRIHILPSTTRLGACANFNQLLQASTHEYVMFSDHDDIWEANKISQTARRMHEEELLSPGTPLLVFTDTAVIDKNGVLLGQSAQKMQHIDPYHQEFIQIAFQNIGNGSTMMLNRKLVETIGQIPPQAIMHDHWTSLVASTFGKISYINVPTVRYRKHDHNVFGPAQYGICYWMKKFFQGPAAIKKNIQRKEAQIQAFYDEYSNRIPVGKQKQISSIIGVLKSKQPLKKRLYLLRCTPIQSGVLRDIGLLFFI